MNTTLTDTAATLYAAILLQPEDDTLRLAFADALDDAGDHDRAEFVRVQMELASLGSPVPNTAHVCELAYREHELLAAHGDGWRRGEKCERCYCGTYTPADRGSPMTCPFCRGTGYTSPLSGSVYAWTDDPATTHHLKFIRGLVGEYSSTHSRVFDRDGPREWACEVARAFPIERVVLTDRPVELIGPRWWISDVGNGVARLAMDMYWGEHQEDHIDYAFPTRELAEHYQALAVAQRVRRAAFEEKR